MFNLRKGKQTKIIIMVASGVVFGGLVSGIFVGNHYSNKVNAQQRTYEEALAAKDGELKRYQLSSKQGYVLVNHLDAGDKIKEEDVTLTDLPDFFVPTNVISDKDAIVGSIIKLTSEPQTPITDQMVRVDGRLDDSARKVELDYVRLPYKLAEKDILDIRILFPNGENYNILKKKKMTGVDIPASMMFMDLTIEEVYLMDSALVDAHLQKAEIYAAPYVEPELQESALESYIPNIAVLNVIKSDPAIIVSSRYSMAEDVRKSLEARLAAMPEENKHRLGADIPEGSAVGKRKAVVGATVVGGQTSATPQDGPVDADGNPLPEGFVPAPEGATTEIGE